MDRLWSPWRYRYVSKKGLKECIFCVNIALNDDKTHYILHRAEKNFVLLNLYPYTERSFNDRSVRARAFTVGDPNRLLCKR